MALVRLYCSLSLSFFLLRRMLFAFYFIIKLSDIVIFFQKITRKFKAMKCGVKSCTEFWIRDLKVCQESCRNGTKMSGKKRHLCTFIYEKKNAGPGRPHSNPVLTVALNTKRDLISCVNEKHRPCQWASWSLEINQITARVSRKWLDDGRTDAKDLKKYIDHSNISPTSSSRD